MNFRAEYQLHQFAAIDSGVSYLYVCVCLNLIKNPDYLNWCFCTLVTKIDQIDPISLD